MGVIESSLNYLVFTDVLKLCYTKCIITLQIFLFKLNKCFNDLIGIPYQIIIGKRDIKDNLIEIKERQTYLSTKINTNDLHNYLINKIKLKF